MAEFIDFYHGDGHITLLVDDNESWGDQEEVKEAINKLKTIVADPRFGKSGYRNDSVVDAMLYCMIAGINFDALLDAMYGEGWLDAIDYSECELKADIVRPYAEGWVCTRVPFAYEIGTLLHQ